MDDDMRKPAPYPTVDESLTSASADVDYLRIIAATASDMITIATSRAFEGLPHFVYVNQSCAHAYGYTVDELIGATVDIFYGPDTEYRELHDWLPVAKLNEHRTIEMLTYRKDKTTQWIELTVHFVELHSDGRAVYVSVARDITDRRNKLARIDELSNFDALTGLLNRASLSDALATALRRSDLNRLHTAVLHLDVDDLNDVNELYGRCVGDRLLVALACRLKDCLRTGDLAARQGNDDFIVALTDIDGPGRAQDIAKRIQAAMWRPFQIEGHEIHTSVSIGIGTNPPGLDAEGLMQNANVALLAAKAEGKNRVYFYAPDMHRRIVDRAVLVRDIRRALAAHEFVAFLQPVIDLATGDLIGSEALVRWQHPTKGLLQPSSFITAAEDASLMHLIGYEVRREACRDAIGWDRLGGPELQVGVNASPREILMPGFSRAVLDTLEISGLRPDRLVLEVTESAMLDDTSRTVEALKTLQSSGVRIALDDFGTGYSSLAWLKQIPVDVVKIDRSFVAGLTPTTYDGSMVDIIITIGRKLGLSVVAEGVETAEQARLLREHGCDYAQGYYFSKPLPPADFERWVLGRAELEHAS